MTPQNPDDPSPWGPPQQPPNQPAQPQQQGWGQPPSPPPQQGWGQAPPPPPRWGDPAQRPTPPKKPGRGRIILAVAIVIVGLAIVGAIGGNDGTSPSSSQATDQPATAAAPATGTPATDAPAADTPAQESATPSVEPLGATVQFEDSFGKHAIDVTVVRRKVSTGGEFDKPDHGVYVGLHVRVKAFADGISVPDFYTLASGHHFDPTFATGFTPDFNRVYELNAGESHEGWLVFDMPSPHGRIVMKEFASDKPQAIWQF